MLSALFQQTVYPIGNCRLCVSMEEMSAGFSYAAISDHLSLLKTHFFFFFTFIFISWRLITLQYCSGFCHTWT